MARKPKIRRGRVISARKEVAAQHRLRQGFEKRLSRSVFRVFRLYGKDAAAEFVEKGEVGDAGLELYVALFNVLAPHYRQVINTFARRTLRHLQRDNTEFEQMVQTYLLGYGAIAIKNITETTRDRILEIILLASKKHMSPEQIAVLIVEEMGGRISRRRAITIARTETHGASTYASYKVAQSFIAEDVEKKWLSTIREHARPEHRALHGVQIPMDEDFKIIMRGVPYRMSRPGDPRGGAVNNVRCGCCLVYVSPEDEVADLGI